MNYVATYSGTDGARGIRCSDMVRVSGSLTASGRARRESFRSRRSRPITAASAAYRAGSDRGVVDILRESLTNAAIGTVGATLAFVLVAVLRRVL